MTPENIFILSLLILLAHPAHSTVTDSTLNSSPPNVTTAGARQTNTTRPSEPTGYSYSDKKGKSISCTYSKPADPGETTTITFMGMINAVSGAPYVRIVRNVPPSACKTAFYPTNCYKIRVASGFSDTGWVLGEALTTSGDYFESHVMINPTGITGSFLGGDAGCYGTW